jgi:hypothetical protein
MATHPVGSTPSQQVDAHLHKVPLTHAPRPGVALHQRPHLGNHTTLPHPVPVYTTTSLPHTVLLPLPPVRQHQDLHMMLQHPEVGKVVRRPQLLRGVRIQSRCCIRGLMPLRRSRVLQLQRRMGVGMGSMRRRQRRGMGRGILIVMRSERGGFRSGVGMLNDELQKVEKHGRRVFFFSGSCIHTIRRRGTCTSKCSHKLKWVLV